VSNFCTKVRKLGTRLTNETARTVLVRTKIPNETYGLWLVRIR